MQREFCNLSAENFDLLTCKGIFPYKYINCVEKLEDTCLLPRESFYSSLIDDIWGWLRARRQRVADVLYSNPRWI